MKPETAYRKDRMYTSGEEECMHPWAVEGVEENTALAEMEIRARLCAALGDMSESMRALLGLMGRHNFITVLPDKSFPAYEQIMDRIGTAVSQATQVVERSRALDRRRALTELAPGDILRQ